MSRVLLIALVVLIGIVSASALLVMGAESDDESATSTEHLPRGDEPREQDDQQQSEPLPEPPEDDAEATEATDDAEPDAADEAEEGSADEPLDEEQEEVAAEESQEEEPAVMVEDAEPDPADVVIKALDIERPLIVAEVELTVTTSAYTVEPGDTLSDIAGRLGITLQELIAANEIDSPDVVDVGLELTIPGAESVVESDAAPEPSFEPNEVAPVLGEEGVIYGTIHDHERGVVDTAVIFTSQSDPTVQLVEACIDGVRRTYLMGLQLTDELTRLYWRIDAGALNTDRWRAGDELLESIRASLIFDDLGEATSLWLRVGGVDLTFGVANLGPNEILHNFFICGR